MRTTPVTNDEISAGEDVFLGEKQNAFKFIESPGKITIIDLEKKTGIDLCGNFDAAAVKKDLIEGFKKEPFTVDRTSIGTYVSGQKDKNDLYRDVIAERHYQPVKISDDQMPKKPAPLQDYEKELETAKKTGYVQGVCECVGIVSPYDQNMGKKILSEMNVTKDMAQKFAKPETYKALENGIFAQRQEQKREQTQGIRR